MGRAQIRPSNFWQKKCLKFLMGSFHHLSTRHCTFRTHNSWKLLRDSVQKRLLMNSDYVIAGRWNEALGLKALPPNVPKSLETLANLMDDMWHYAGDTSADVSFTHHRPHLNSYIYLTLICFVRNSFLGTRNEPCWLLYTSRLNYV